MFSEIIVRSASGFWLNICSLDLLVVCDTLLQTNGQQSVGCLLKRRDIALFVEARTTPVGHQ